MDEQAGLENRSPSRDRGFESHPLRHNTKAIPLSVELPYQFIAVYAGGIRTGVLKGVRPLHGVTGATRRREGAWPPSGSTEAPSVRLRIPTPSANDCLPYIKVPSPVLLSALQRLVGCERGS